MTSGLILLTGSSGQVGYRILIDALSAGYFVSAAVRGDAAIQKIQATQSIQPYLSNVDFITVEDITKEGAFDAAVKGVDYIVHVASPFPHPSEDLEGDFVKPAVKGTESILYSALKEQSSIKRVIITSSVLAVLPLSAFEGKDPGVLTPDSFVANPDGPYANYFVAYAAGKIMAYNRTADFIKNMKPSFTVVNILPTFIIGKNELATTPEAVNSGSNAVALVPVLGHVNPEGALSITVHIDDVAKMHILALSPALKGNFNLAANSNNLEGIKWNNAIEIVTKMFPQEVASGLFPLGGSQGSNLVRFDARATEKLLNFKFKGFEEQISDLAAWYAKVSIKNTT